ADDSKRREIAVHVAELHELSERILAGPLPFRERTAHERDVLGSGPIVAVEQASTQQRNAERAEVAVARDAIFRKARAARIALPARREVVERLHFVGAP